MNCNDQYNIPCESKKARFLPWWICWYKPHGFHPQSLFFGVTNLEEIFKMGKRNIQSKPKWELCYVQAPNLVASPKIKWLHKGHFSHKACCCDDNTPPPQKKAPVLRENICGSWAINCLVTFTEEMFSHLWRQTERRMITICPLAKKRQDRSLLISWVRDIKIKTSNMLWLGKGRIAGTDEVSSPVYDRPHSAPPTLEKKC